MSNLAVFNFLINGQNSSRQPRMAETYHGRDIANHIEDGNKLSLTLESLKSILSGF